MRQLINENAIIKSKHLHIAIEALDIFILPLKSNKSHDAVKTQNN
jgi:hypothetical protein